MSSPNNKTLLVILTDRPSQLIAKGEITPRYYNPGEVFEDVHLLLTNDDRPDLTQLQKTVGRARLTLHNLPAGKDLFLRSMGWQPALLERWAEEGVRIAEAVRPSLLRTYGNTLNGFLAARIKNRLRVPLVTSLHINPDEDTRGRLPWRSAPLERLLYERMVPLEKMTLRSADMVLPVYEPIRPYAVARGARRIEVCYNFLNPECLRQKTDYTLGAPPRILSVGRLMAHKNPGHLIRAIQHLPQVRLTIVGDGPLRADLMSLAEQCSVADRIEFLAAVPNDELCRMLPRYDLFAVHSQYWEISKSVLEALLTGLPVIINKRRGHPVAEFDESFICLVENSVKGYHDAVIRLLEDDTLREKLGRDAFYHAQERWAPAVTERKYAEIYRRLLEA